MAAFEKHIYDFVLQNQLLALEGLGVFYVSQDKTSQGPTKIQVVYQHDKKTGTTPAFVDYVAEREGKNKMLISSDVQSFLIEAKQLINIGRPFVIPGLGFIQLGKTGQYQFVEQSISDVKHNEPQQPKPKAAEVSKNNEQGAAYVASTDNKSTQKNQLGVVVFVILFILAGGIAWSVYYYMHQKKTIAKESEQLLTADTVHTTAPAPDTTAALPQVIKRSSNDYRFVFERTFTSGRALKRYNQLVSYNIPVYIDSSAVPVTGMYKLYALRHLPDATDTLIKKDSLSKYFGSAIDIEAN